jgi:pilus assembly protein CpaB
MSVRTIMIVALALVIGLSAAAGVNMVINNRSGAAVVETVPVVTAAVAIPRGGSITAQQLKLADYPRRMVPTGALTKLEDAVDRGVYIPMVPGEPVLEAKLAPKGAGRGLAALVPTGMRAFTIQTPNVASGVAGFILPGNHVDVLLTMTGGNDDGSGGGSTTTLLQKVEILAVDQKIDAPADNKMDSNQLRSVTLLVTPGQAARLDLGQNKGTLHLSLRNMEDNLAALTAPATMNELRFHQEKPWDERAKGVLAALAKALAEGRKADPPAPPAVKEPEEPKKVHVRTLRGMSEGRVSIHLPDSTSSDR